MSAKHSGISTEEEIQLITEVIRHPPLYEKDGKIKYGDDRYNASWDEVSKHLGIDVNVCRTKWTAIENDYKRKNIVSNIGHNIDSSQNLDKSHDTDNSQMLIGLLSMAGVDRPHFVGRLTFDIESVSGEQCKSKTAYETLRDRIFEDVMFEPKNDENERIYTYTCAIKENCLIDSLPKKSLQCMTTQKERCQSEDFTCEVGDKRKPPITVANQTHGNEKDEITNIDNNIPNEIIKKVCKEVKCGIIKRVEKYCDNDAKKTFPLVPVLGENPSNDNATGDSTEVIKCKDIENKKLNGVMTKQQILFDGISEQSNSESVTTIDLTDENVTKKRRNVDTSHDEDNISNLSYLNKKVRLEERSPLEDRNSRNLYGNCNLQATPLVDIQKNCVSNLVGNSQSSYKLVDDIITSLVSKKIQESAHDIPLPNVSYVSNVAEGRMTAISPPYIVLNHSDKEVPYETSYLTKNMNTCHTINAGKSMETYELNNNLNISNSFSTEKNSSNRTVHKSQNALTNHNSRERLTILNINTNQTDMNVFFDELAKYVSHTYPSKKQIDIRKKICDLVTTMETEDPDQT